MVTPSRVCATEETMNNHMVMPRLFRSRELLIGTFGHDGLYHNACGSDGGVYVCMCLSVVVVVVAVVVVVLVLVLVLIVVVVVGDGGGQCHRFR